MRIAILGAGAIGAYVGAMLARGGADVWLIARGPHGETMRRDGVRVISDGDDFTVRPPVTDDPSEVGEVDAVFLGLKAQQYADAGPMLEPLLAPATTVVSAQNGIPWWYFYKHGGPFDGRRIESVDPGGAVSAAIPPWRAVGCVVYASTELDAPGVVRHIEGVRFPIGEPDGRPSERSAAFSQAMRAAGLKAPVLTRIREHIWLKLMGNAVFNPLSALAHATMAEISEFGPTRETAARVMTEIAQIARALGCEPQLSVEQRLAGAAQVGHHKTSMLQDLEAGKPLEVDALLTAVVELADLIGEPAPSLRTLHAAVALLDLTRRAVPTESKQVHVW
jgi:2-dehydropantoate 2-reductase